MVNQQRICPYPACNDLNDRKACLEVDMELPPPDGGGHLQYCANDNIKRIVKTCPRCGTTNQLIAQYCRSCGGKDFSPHICGWEPTSTQWHVRTPAPKHTAFSQVPQPAVYGDLLISFHQMHFVVSTLSGGLSVMKFLYPENPGFFSSPVTVNSRVYSFVRGGVVGFSLVTGEASRTNLPGFEPSDLCAPIHVPFPDDDYLLMGGKDTFWVVDVRNGDGAHRRIDMELGPGDAVLTPVWVPSLRKALVTTKLGGFYTLAFKGKTMDSADLIPHPIAMQEKKYFSAPAYNSETNTLAFEWVPEKTRSRCVYVNCLGGKHKPKIHKIEERYRDDELDYLMFPPMFAGGYGVLASLRLPRHPCFFDLTGVKRAEVKDLDMTPVSSAACGNRIVSVQEDRIISFVAAPVDQDGTPRAQLPSITVGDMVTVARPVCANKVVIVQQRQRLIGWEVDGLV